MPLPSRPRSGANTRPLAVPTRPARPASLLAPVLLALGLAAAAACSPQPNLDQLVFHCENDRQCAPDKVCHMPDGYCVDPAALGGDAGTSDGLAGDSGASDAGPDATPTGSATCATYCDAVTLSCQGVDAQYEDRASCEALCQAATAPGPGGGPWWTGGPAGQDADTLDCRQAYAQKAALVSPGANCAAASPSGGGRCGSLCESYCDAAMSLCGGDNALFADRGTCLTSCGALDAAGAPGDLTGDTVSCRLSYLALGFAYAAPEVFCAAAAPLGGACSPVSDAIPAPTCENYCAIVSAACDATAPEYATPAECLGVCAEGAKLAPGEAGDTTQNTIACRIAHTMVGFVEHPELHCPVGGVGGGNVCGSWCNNYCALAMANCAGGDTLYDSAAACAIACASQSTAGRVGDLESDTVQCRMTYLLQAGASDAPTPLCANAGFQGGPCVVKPPTCEDYCQAVQGACGDAGAATAQYDDEAACLAFCGDQAALAPGAAGDAGGNTIGCRMTFAQAAASAMAGGGEGTTECLAAGPTGGNLCGSWCDNYCHMALENCLGDDALYADMAQCINTCATFPSTGQPGDLTGDTAQCRIAHLALAGASTEAPGDHCPQGSADSTANACR